MNSDLVTDMRGSASSIGVNDTANGGKPTTVPGVAGQLLPGSGESAATAGRSARFRYELAVRIDVSGIRERALTVTLYRPGVGALPVRRTMGKPVVSPELRCTYTSPDKATGTVHPFGLNGNRHPGL